MRVRLHKPFLICYALVAVVSYNTVYIFNKSSFQTEHLLIKNFTLWVIELSYSITTYIINLLTN